MRREDWPRRLEGEIYRHARFRWGRFDCCLFPANCVLAMTGWDPAEQWRGYRTRKEAEEIVAEYGGVIGLLEHALKDCPEVSPMKAQRGDVVAIEHQSQEWGVMPGVILNNGQPGMMGRRGVISAPRQFVSRAWRI